MTGKQKRALEKITGKPWDSWNPEVAEAYFAFTDRGDDLLIKGLLGENWGGICIPIWRGEANEIQIALFELIMSHKFHAYTVECWKEDFKKGLLVLGDFDDSPDAYKEHVKEIYDSVMAQ